MTSSTDFNDDRHELILRHLQGKLNEKEQLHFLRLLDEDPSLREELTFMQMLRLGGQGLGKQYLEEEKESIDQIKISRSVPKRPLIRRLSWKTMAKVAVLLCFLVANLGFLNNMQQHNLASYIDFHHQEKEKIQSAIEAITNQQQFLNFKLNLLGTYWQQALKKENTIVVSDSLYAENVDSFIIDWGATMYKIQDDYKQQKQIIKLYESKLDTLKNSLKSKNLIIQSYCKDIVEREEEISKINILLKNFEGRESYYLSEINNIVTLNNN